MSLISTRPLLFVRFREYSKVNELNIIIRTDYADAGTSPTHDHHTPPSRRGAVGLDVIGWQPKFPRPTHRP